MTGIIDDLDCPPQITEKYLPQLLDSTVSQIKQQPGILAHEAASLATELVGYVQAEYSTHLKAHTYLVDISAQIRTYPKLLSGINDLLPEITSDIAQLNALAEAQKSEKQTLLKIKQFSSVISELLEIPALLDTLVQNERYEQAMELQAFTKRVFYSYSVKCALPGYTNIFKAK